MGLEPRFIRVFRVRLRVRVTVRLRFKLALILYLLLCSLLMRRDNQIV